MKEQPKNKKNTAVSISPEMRAILDQYNEDIKRHMSALSEDFQSKVAIIAEQTVGTNDKVDGVETRLTNKIDGVIHVQETHTEMVGAIMEDVSEIKTELKNKADKIEVTRLERRVLSLEHAT
jgi:hypothetical protein